jgi:transcriptional antiterminator RfaH
VRSFTDEESMAVSALTSINRIARPSTWSKNMIHRSEHTTLRASVAESGGPSWYCLRTHAKHEHVAAAHLRQIPEVSVFNPQLRMLWFTRRGRMQRMESLFPNYLFARFNLESTLERVKYTPTVKSVLQFGGMVPAIPDAVIEDLRQTMADSASVVFTEGPVMGEEVEIGCGPLEGLKGKVISVRPSKERVKVLLDILGRYVPAELSLECVLYRKRDPGNAALDSPALLPTSMAKLNWTVEAPRAVAY